LFVLRLAKILAAGIIEVFRGLKFEHNIEDEQNNKLYKVFVKEVIYG